MVSDREASKARIQSTPPTGHSINCDTMCRMSLSYFTTTGSISVEYYKYHYYGKQSFDGARRGRNGFDEEQEEWRNGDTQVWLETVLQAIAVQIDLASIPAPGDCCL